MQLLVLNELLIQSTNNIDEHPRCSKPSTIFNVFQLITVEPQFWLQLHWILKYTIRSVIYRSIAVPYGEWNRIIKFTKYSQWNFRSEIRGFPVYVSDTGLHFRQWLRRLLRNCRRFSVCSCLHSRIKCVWEHKYNCIFS